MSEPNPHLSGPFQIAPSGPTSISFMLGTQHGDQVMVMVVATPHVCANYWFGLDEWDKLMEGAKAVRLGLLIPNGQH